jgi:hypothetical protein
MTRKASLALLFLSLAGLAAAFDSGLELSNLGGVKNTGDQDWYTDHKITGWLKIPFDNANTNSLAIEGSMYAAKPANESDLTCFADIDLFRFTLRPVSTPDVQLSLDAGRIPVSDITGLILNQTVDGAEFHGTFKFGNVDALAAYTGLLNAQKEGAMMSTDDFADADTDKFYAFGSKRALAKVAVQFPQLVAGSDLVIQGAGQYDLRPSFESDPVQTVHTGYGTAMLSGLLAGPFFYSVSGTFQTGVMKENDTWYSEHSALCSVRLDCYPVPGHSLYAQFIYTPPEGSFFSTYLPITFQNAGTLFSYGYGNLMRASAGWNFNPYRFLNFDIGAKSFMYSEKPEYVESMYRGTEISGGATIKATSDLRFRLDGASLFQYKDDTLYQFSLKAIFDL